MILFSLIILDNLKEMQSNSNFSNTTRNSYGFSNQEQFQKRNSNNPLSAQVPQFVSQLPPRY
jgi:hypothetical protein